MIKFARSITKWTESCHKRVNRLISYIHHKCEYKQYCHVGNTAKQCRLALFQDSDFCGRSSGFKIYLGWNIVRFGKSYISLDAGLRVDGIPALDFWDLIVAVLGNTNQSHEEQGDLLMNKREARSPPHTIHKRKQSQRVIWIMLISFPQTSNLLIRKLCCMCLKTNEAVIKMIIKGKESNNETCFQNPQSCA